MLGYVLAAIAVAVGVAGSAYTYSNGFAAGANSCEKPKVECPAKHTAQLFPGNVWVCVKTGGVK